MLNKITIIGRLGSDPEVKYLDNNNVLARFSVATYEHWKDKKGEKQEETQWHNIVLWGGLAEIAEKYLKKGQLVCIAGKVTYRSWEGEDGQKKYMTEIVGRELVMLGGGSGGKQNAPDPTPPQSAQGNSPEEDDDLPF